MIWKIDLLNTEEENNKFKGALASKIAAQIYGLKVLQANVQDNKDNTTRFLVMEKYQIRFLKL